MNINFLSNQVISTYLLREKRKVFVPVSERAEGGVSAHHLAGLQADIAQLGFTLAGDVVAELRLMNPFELGEMHRALVKVAQEAVGANVKYRPLFKKFPEGIPQDADYLLRRLIGYVESYFGPLGDNYTVLSCGHVVNHHLFDLESFGACPVCQHQTVETDEAAQATAVRPPLNELTPLRVLTKATDADVWEAFSNLAKARTSLSDSQKGFLKAVIELDAEQSLRKLPKELPYKENAALMVSSLLRAGVEVEPLFGYVKTPTDVLRVVVGLCGGDLSLKENTRFKLRNAERRFVMRALEALPQRPEHLLEEMVGYAGRWVRLGEVLHVGQHRGRYPKVAECFDVLRNREGSITTHASRVEALLNGGNLKQDEVRTKLLAALAQRPGELARKIDVLVQRGIPAEELLPVLKATVASVSTPILLTLLAHFRNRGKRAAFRAFMPKGSVAKMQVIAGDTRKPIVSSTAVELLTLVREELVRRFAERAPLGKVYIADELRGALVPFSQRSASEGVAPLTRGSRLPYDTAKNIVRLFLNWKDTADTGIIDVDLSCTLYSEGWCYKHHLSWTNMRSHGNCRHSGDVRSGSGPDGAAEFIDLDVEALRRSGIRYAAISVYSWTGQQFSQFPCFAGFMERENAKAGEVFEAKTVKNKFAVTGDKVIMVPMYLDLETNEVVWADMALKGKAAYNSLESQNERIVEMLKAIEAMPNGRVSLKELFDLHVEARGTKVSSREEAELVLDDAKLFELDDVIANWL